MGPARRSTRNTTTSYFRRAPYNLRSRSRARVNYYDTIAAGDGDKPEVVAETKPEPLPKIEKLELNTDKNKAAHHTDQYEVDYLVLRRGQSFTFSLRLARALNDDEKALFIISTGRNPYPSKGTLLSFRLNQPSKKFGWSVESTTKGRQEFDIKITSSQDALIGMYAMAVQLSSPSTTKTLKMKESFCLIFNPWEAKDDVYVADEKQREEYVMNETGRIWVGSKVKSYGKPWVFGQFEECSLEAALYILEISDLSDGAMSNPVIIARTFSKMSNSFDDNGILTGNWSGDYSGGVEPTDWISSVDILSEFMETRKEVKYGQCWVFSGLLTTLFRAVGIPARSITNFESAHDNDGSMTIDRHWDYEDKPLTDLNDSIWNFHVWNECWFKRNDLPDGHDGWQVVDGTPQENSEGVMQCGPASLHSIKEGEVYLPYDAKFVIAEVNGDIIEWVQEKDKDMTPVWKEAASVGFNISTKSVGSNDREDVTHLYKYPEGSSREREVIKSISKFSSRKEDLLDFYDVSETKTVNFELSGDGHSSGDVDIKLDLKSSDKRDLNVDVTLTCVASYYNGVTGDDLKTLHKSTKLFPGTPALIEMALEGKDYLNKIATDAMITVFCKAKVRETGQRFFKKETFTVDHPDIELEAPGSVHRGQEFTVDVSFHNELSIPLTECRLIVEGPGVYSVKPVKIAKSVIGAGDKLNQTITFKARASGFKEIIAHLHTRQLQNITGSTSIRVY